MRYLYINNGQGLFSVSGDEKTAKTIDQIEKGDLLKLITLIVDSEADDEFEMDAYDAEKIKNPAHRIIYKNIYDKFEALLQKRVSFADETSNLYKAAIEKYSIELESEE